MEQNLIPTKPPARASTSLVLLGYGAMGRGLYRALMARHPGIRIGAIIVPPAQIDEVRAELGQAISGGTRVVGEVASARDADTQLLVECAGHSALLAHGPQALRAGLDLLVASVGALAQPSIEAELRASAGAGRSRVLIPSGALGGLDVLAAAALAGIDQVSCTSTKAPNAWRGTPAEKMVDLDALTETTTFFRGSAREAALTFPQNANVAAAVAVAGIGFDTTRIELRADPAATGNTHRVQAHGAFGQLDVTVQALTLAANPKTSMLAPMSLLQAIVKREAALGMA